MNPYRNNQMSSAAAAAVLALGTLGINLPVRAATEPPTAALEHNVSAEKATADEYEREALAFEAEADLHSRIAKRYRAPDNGGSKQRMTLWSLANHYEWLAKTDLEAAQRARTGGAAGANLGSLRARK